MNPLVGRDVELAELVRRSAATEPRAELVVITGEAGIGKSRLVGEFGDWAAADGSVVLRGGCDDVSLRSYQPFAEALIGHARSFGDAELRELLGPLVPRLGPLVPAWARLPRTPLDGGTLSLGVADQETARLELFDAVVEMVDQFSGERRCVVVIEDLHWAGAATLAMLRHLVAASFAHPPMVVVTIRPFSTLVDPVADAVARLVRADGTTVIELRGLDQQAVADLARAKGLDDPDAASAALFRRTAGNPLFVCQLLDHARGGGSLDELPRTLRHVIGQHLAQLGAEVGGVLQCAAVIGETFSYRLLESAAPMGEADLASSVEQAVEAGVIVEVDPYGLTYGFSHALVRDAIDAATAAPRRSRLHRSIALALEDSHDAAAGETRLAGLAHHWARADGPDAPGRALVWALEAASRSLDLLAPEEAIATLASAIAISERDPGADIPKRIDARLLLAFAFEELGQSALVREASQAAADEARGVSEEQFLRAVYMRAELELGTADATAHSLLNEALDLIGDREPGWRILILRELAALQFFSEGAPHEALATIEQALAEARLLNVPEVLAVVYATVSLVLQPFPDMARRIEIIREWEQLTAVVSGRERHSSPTSGSGAIAQMEIRSWNGEFGVKLALAQALLETGDLGFSAAIERAAAVVEQARSLHAQRALAAFRASHALMRGEFEEAESAITTTLAMDDDLNDDTAIALGQFLLLRREQGRMSEVMPFAHEVLEHRPGLRAVEPALALGALEGGDADGARRIIEELLRRDPVLPLDVTWLTGMCLLAEAMVVLEVSTRASEIYDGLLPYSGRIAVAGAGGAIFGTADRALGQLALVLGKFEDAERHLDDALQLEQRFGARPLAARSAYWAARARLACPFPDFAAADRLLASAEAEAEALGMPDLADATRQLMSGGDTVLTTIVFTDVVDSTPLIRELGDAVWRDRLDAHERLVVSALERHGGRVVQFTGDGYLTEFTSPVRAVRGALAMMDAAAEVGFAVRAGVHCGECQRRGDTLAGIAVHVGARIAAAAQGNQVLVSRTVADLASGSGLRFRSLGSRDLKGVGTTTELLEVAIDAST